MLNNKTEVFRSATPSKLLLAPKAPLENFRDWPAEYGCHEIITKGEGVRGTFCLGDFLLGGLFGW